MRHVWEEYVEKAEDIRHTLGNKAVYELRKETIERIFGTAKGQYGFRYTQYIGKARMEMKAGLTFACMNLKKLARILFQRNQKSLVSSASYWVLLKMREILFFRQKWCWRLTPTPALSTVCGYIKYLFFTKYLKFRKNPICCSSLYTFLHSP